MEHQDKVSVLNSIVALVKNQPLWVLRSMQWAINREIKHRSAKKQRVVQIMMKNLDKALELSITNINK